MGNNFNYQAVANTIADNNTDRQTAAGVGSFLSNALAYYQQAQQKQKLDAIANSITAAQNTQNDQSYAAANAKPATAVSADDPDLQGTLQYNPAGGPVYQYTDGASPGDPPTDAQMASDNAALGYGYNENPTLPAAPGDIPATGGYAGLQLRQQMQAAQTNQQLQAARIRSYLANAAAAPTKLDIMRQHLVNIQATAPDPTTGLTPNQTRQQGNFETTNTRLVNTYGPGGTAGVRPQIDTMAKLNSDLQTSFGVGISDIRAAGREDTVQQPGGVLYRIGGDNDQYGRPKPKVNVFIPQAEQDQFMSRYQGIVTGKPAILNQPSLNAAQLYRSSLNGGSPATGAPPATTAPAGTQLPQNSSAPTGSLFGAGGTAAAPASASTTAAATSPVNEQAVAWAMANRNDLRSDAILNQFNLQ